MHKWFKLVSILNQEGWMVEAICGIFHVYEYQLEAELYIKI